MNLWHVVWFGALSVCIYVYFLYPVLLFVVSRVRHRPVRKAPVTAKVSIIVGVFNEERVVERKIKNCLDLTYPASSLEILIASNGSTDRTEEIVRRLESERVKLISIPDRGKALGINAAAERATGEVLVFTDANTLLEPEALSRLMENFADPEVGAVCGRKLQRTDEDSDVTSAGEGLYWRYEGWQKSLESRIGSCYIGDGALHAIRRKLFVPIADPAHGDDVAISTRAVLGGSRLVYEPRAIVVETAPKSARAELGRKIRIANRCMRALFGLGPRLWLSGFYSVELVSHKLLRYMVPWFLLLLLISNAALARSSSVFAWLLAGQVLFYLLAVVGFLLREHRLGRFPLFYIPFYFCFVNLGAFIGSWTLVRGTRQAAWSPRAGLGS